MARVAHGVEDCVPKYYQAVQYRYELELRRGTRVRHKLEQLFRFAFLGDRSMIGLMQVNAHGRTATTIWNPDKRAELLLC